MIVSYLIILRLCEGGKIRAKIGPVYPDQDTDQDLDTDQDQDPDTDQDQDPDQDLDQDLDLDLDLEIFCLRDRFISYYTQIV